MNTRLWLRMIWRDVRFHPILWGLSLLGIATGVGGWLGMEGATQRAQSAFESSLNATFGNATHVVENRTGPLSERTYFQLARTIPDPVTPILESYGRIPAEDGNRNSSVQVMGIDPLSYGQFQTGIRQSDVPFDAFLAGNPIAVLSPDLRKRYDKGDRFPLTMNGERRTLEVVGFLSNSSRRRTVLMDVGLMQSQFAFGDELSRVLIHHGGSTPLPSIKDQLGSEAVLFPTGRRTRSVRSMLRSFQWNLRALSFLALFVGGFLVYSTMYLYASRHTDMISLLKTMGTSDRSICFLLFGGLGVLGVTGSLLGVVIGVLLSAPLGQLVRGTVNNLYLPLFTTGQTLSGGRIVLGFLLGLLMTFVGGFKPVWDRIGVPPRAWTREGSGNGASLFRPQALFVAGLAAWGLAAVLFLGVHDILAGFASCFLIAFGGSLMSPLVLNLVSRVPRGGLWTRMVTRNLRFYGSRTSVMVAVLVAAFSLVLSVSFMVDSFRGSVHQWINSVVQADHYVRSVPEGNVREQVPLDDGFLDELRQTPGVEAVGLLAEKTVMIGDGKPLTLRGVEPNVLRGRLDFQFNDTNGDPWDQLADGQLWLSEPGSFRLDRSVGDTLDLPVSDDATRSFSIGAVYNDYSTEWAVAYIPLSRMKSLYNDVTVSSAAIFTDGTGVRARLQDLADRHDHYLETNEQIRRDAMAEFDRTFAVTDVMEVVASLVAGIGLLILLISFTQSRAWIFGRMSAVGSSRMRLSGLIAGESLLISLAAFLVSVPTGLYLSYVLLRVINRQSFGWLIPFQLRFAPIGIVFVLLMMTLSLALIYPVYKMLTVPLSDLLMEGRS
jgi:putative ABC transport system permease protein